MNDIKPFTAQCSMIAMVIVCLGAGNQRESDRALVGPTVGQPAPKIELTALLNAPSEAPVSWDGLRGKVVVLEFWGTYCAPCVANIPLMNKLEAEFADEPVVFLHVTDEDEKTVRKFLKRTPIHGWVGIDDGRATFKNFGVTGLPHAAVVGKDGRIRGFTIPAILVNEPEILRDVLEKGSSDRLWSEQPVGSPVPSRTIREGSDEAKDYLCDIIMRRSRPGDRSSDDDGNMFTRFDETLADHISFFCGLPPSQIITTVSLPEEHYDVVALSRKAWVPGFRETVCRLIELTFDVSIRREKRTLPVYVLRTLPEREPVLTRSLGMVYTDASSAEFVGEYWLG